MEEVYVFNVYFIQWNYALTQIAATIAAIPMRSGTGCLKS